MKKILAVLALFLPSLLTAQQIDITTGGAGSVTGVPQSYNESRAVDVTVLSAQDVALTSMMLRRFYTGTDGIATVGVRIYDSASTALLYSLDTTVHSLSNGNVSIPVSFVLSSGHTYRLGFYSTGPNSDNTANLFQPSSFPYTDSTGLLSIRHAWAFPGDVYPTNTNIFVPIIRMGYELVTGIENISDPEISVYPNPAGNQISIHASKPVDEVSICDLAGRILLTKISAGSTELMEDVSILPPGLYLVGISSGDRTKVFKLVKQ